MKQVPNQRREGLFARYGVFGLLALALDVAYTRLRFPAARMVKRPCHIRGRRWIQLGARFNCGRDLRMDAFGCPATKGPLIRIGDGVEIHDYVHIGAVESVTIGDRVLIASKVFITDHDHGSYGRGGVHTDPRTPPKERPLSVSPVVIEEDVWLGELVMVLPGVRIGKGSVVGAMSTVTRDLPPYSLAVGSPARVIKQYNFDSSTWERV